MAEKRKSTLIEKKRLQQEKNKAMAEKRKQTLLAASHLGKEKEKSFEKALREDRKWETAAYLKDRKVREETYLTKGALDKEEARRDREAALTEKRRFAEEETSRKDTIARNKRLLNEYIEHSLSKGVSVSKLKKALVEKGWHEKFVQQYANRYFAIHESKIMRVKELATERKEKDLYEAQLRKINERLRKLK